MIRSALFYLILAAVIIGFAAFVNRNDGQDQNWLDKHNAVSTQMAQDRENP